MELLYIAVHEQNRSWGAEFFLNKGFVANDVDTICVDFRAKRRNLVEIVKNSMPFDYLFLQRGDYFPIGILRAIKRPRFFWASELVARNKDQDRLLSSGLFNHVFVHTIACKREIARRGWLKDEQMTVLLNGFDPSFHRPINGVEKDIDVLFIGNMLARRKDWLNEIEQEFSVHKAVGVYGDDMVLLINRAKIVLNIHSENFSDTETRLFEVLGCRSFLLSETLSEDSPFTNEKHLVECGNVQEMCEKIAYYLNHNEERCLIAETGYKEVIEKHTYLKRAEYLKDFFETYAVDKRSPSLDNTTLNNARFESAKLWFVLTLSDTLYKLKSKLRSKLKSNLK